MNNTSCNTLSPKLTIAFVRNVIISDCLLSEKYFYSAVAGARIVKITGNNCHVYKL